MGPNRGRGRGAGGMGGGFLSPISSPGTNRIGMGIGPNAVGQGMSVADQQAAALKELGMLCQQGDQSACIQLAGLTGQSATTGKGRKDKEKKRVDRINELGTYSLARRNRVWTDEKVREINAERQKRAENALLEDKSLGCRKVDTGKTEPVYQIRQMGRGRKKKVKVGDRPVYEIRCADGGMIEEEALLAPEEMMGMPMDMPMDDMESMAVEEGEDMLLPFAEILGEEGMAELEEAIANYPIVADVVSMALKTSDGYVEGEGGPKDDLVPARLSDGEFILTKEAVDMIGVEKLEELNEMAKQKSASYV